MPEFVLHVYRPRIERVSVRVEASSLFDAQILGLELADEVTPEHWEMLPAEANWYAGKGAFVDDPFIYEVHPRLFDFQTGDSVELTPTMEPISAEDL